MADVRYLLAPFLAWFLAGSLKFLINCLQQKRLAFDLIGYGGMPSNHSAIVVTMLALIGTDVGLDAPVFGLAVTLTFIVLLDATSLRRAVGRQAQAINRLAPESGLRERMGHSQAEVAAGALLGLVLGYLLGACL